MANSAETRSSAPVASSAFTPCRSPRPLLACSTGRPSESRRLMCAPNHAAAESFSAASASR
eukprot:756957-Prymnesium_polylepis.1